MMPPSQNRYKHIHVRFSQAILGLRNFGKGIITDTLLTSQISPKETPRFSKSFTQVFLKAF